MAEDNARRSPTSHRPQGPLGRYSESGQSTVEYAILLLGAAAVAMLVVAWVGRSDVIGRLFDAVFGRIISQL